MYWLFTTPGPPRCNVEGGGKHWDCQLITEWRQSKQERKILLFLKWCWLTCLKGGSRTGVPVARARFEKCYGFVYFDFSHYTMSTLSFFIHYSCYKNIGFVWGGIKTNPRPKNSTPPGSRPLILKFLDPPLCLDVGQGINRRLPNGRHRLLVTCCFLMGHLQVFTKILPL